MLQRARLMRLRHPEQGYVSTYCFYGTHLRFGQLAFDIGANRGHHTEYMVRRGARVVAVEPQADLAERLTQQYPNCQVVQAAVSDREGIATLHLGQTDDVASLDPTWPFARGHTGASQVRVTTLAKLIEEHGKPSFVKIDAEGFDHLAIHGLDQPVPHVLFEIHSDRPDNAAAAFDRLATLGEYEYRVGHPGNTWLFTSPQPAAAILAELPTWGEMIYGNVYARLLSR